MKRKTELVNNQYYHIFTKSIEEYKVFNNRNDFIRIINMIQYYKKEDLMHRYSIYMKLSKNEKIRVAENIKNNADLIDIIAFCIMPTHIHLILKQNKVNGISLYMRNILNSYSHYFNVLNDRKGPLWEGKFKNVLIDTDEYMYHLTRYIHLNPVTANLVENPGEWKYSSYNEYLLKSDNRICNYSDILCINSSKYKEFVEERIEYQRELAKIRKLIFD